MLLVIDDASGDVLKRTPVGAKPEPITYDRDGDLLFIGGKSGILEIDLPVYLRDLR
jgi:hypothetical protein